MTNAPCASVDASPALCSIIALAPCPPGLGNACFGSVALAAWTSGGVASPDDDGVLEVDLRGVPGGCRETIVTPTLWVRVDDRLLHGQVTVAWRQHLQPDEIWIVDDAVRADPFLSDVLCAAAPADVTVRVYSVSEALSAWSALLSPAPADATPSSRSLGPCARPDAHEESSRSLGPCARPDAYEESSRSLGPCARPDAHEESSRSPEPRARLSILLLVKSPQVALALAEGGLAVPHLNVGNIAPLPGSKRVFRTISLTPEHIAALDALAQRGVSIAFQLTPDDSLVDWPTLRRQSLGS
jgi:mannose/fructose/N-acetylgalactosamine-specific phosphotransferase system component IIB